MHYYKKNIGDYFKKAGRLSMLQHGAYTLLIDSCYDREEFPTFDQAMDWTWASSKEEIEAVEFVLRKFFVLGQDGIYVQSRIADELERYKILGLVNQLVAVAREARKNKKEEFASSCDELKAILKIELKNDALTKTHAAWSIVVDALINPDDAPPNQEPLTNKPLTTNQEPRTNIKNIPSDKSDGVISDDPESPKPVKPKKPKPDPLDFSCWPSMPDAETLEEYKKVRAKKKSSPLSNTVIKNLGKTFHELADLGYTVDYVMSEMVTRNWTGCQADWIHKPAKNYQQPPVSLSAQPNQQGFLAKFGNQEKEIQGEVIHEQL